MTSFRDDLFLLLTNVPQKAEGFKSTQEVKSDNDSAFLSLSSNVHRL